MAAEEVRSAVLKALREPLRLRGLHVAESGQRLKDEKVIERIDEVAGAWKENNGDDPQRWLLRVDTDGRGGIKIRPLDVQGYRLGIASAKTGRGPTAAVIVRIGVFLTSDVNAYQFAPDWIWLLWFILAKPLPESIGNSARMNAFDLQHQIVVFQNEEVDFTECGLVGVLDPSATRSTPVFHRSITYGEVTRGLATFIETLLDSHGEDSPQLSRADAAKVKRLHVYDGTDPPAMTEMAAKAAAAVDQISVADEQNVQQQDAGVSTSIPPHPSLIGVADEVYRQINGALKAGKRHLMFYGPPGTGKTTLAQYVAERVARSAEEWKLITGSADWSSQDIIGGYQPIEGGKIRFVPGVLLQNFDRPLVIDELNRCDIDKVIGPLFTVLSGHETALPYLQDASDITSPRMTILAKTKTTPAEHEFSPSKEWRLIATINSIDKASLYQMSYALTRRFGWIYVDVPSDFADFVGTYLGLPETDRPDVPVSKIWSAVGKVRKMGAAPIIDIIEFLKTTDPAFSFVAAATSANKLARDYLDAFYVFLLPMLDGIRTDEARKIADEVALALSLPEIDETSERHEGDSLLHYQLRSRLLSMAL